MFVYLYTRNKLTRVQGSSLSSRKSQSRKIVRYHDCFYGEICKAIPEKLHSTSLDTQRIQTPTIPEKEFLLTVIDDLQSMNSRRIEHQHSHIFLSLSFPIVA